MILMPLFLLACVGFLGWVRSSTTLAYFQQEEYDNARFLRAWPDLSLIDFKFTTAVIFLSMLSVLMPLTPFVPAAAGGGALAIAILERRMQTNMKKPWFDPSGTPIVAVCVCPLVGSSRHFGFGV